MLSLSTLSICPHPDNVCKTGQERAAEFARVNKVKLVNNFNRHRGEGDETASATPADRGVASHYSVNAT
jgi:hypothetical protein